MRRCLKYVILLLALLSPALVLAQSGQEDEATDRAETRQKPVTFVAIMPEGSHLTDQQKLALQNKVERIIAKNKVGAGAGTTLFGIKADLDVKDTKRSAGLVRDVTVLSAEVTFTAVNTVDGSVYYSQSVSLHRCGGRQGEGDGPTHRQHPCQRPSDRPLCSHRKQAYCEVV